MDSEGFSVDYLTKSVTPDWLLADPAIVKPLTTMTTSPGAIGPGTFSCRIAHAAEGAEHAWRDGGSPRRVQRARRRRPLRTMTHLRQSELIFIDKLLIRNGGMISELKS